MKTMQSKRNSPSGSFLRYTSGEAFLFAVTCLLLLASAREVFAIGVRIPNQDPAAIARANAFVATADNPSAIYYNPAGITQLEGHQAQIGVLNYMGINTFFESPTGAKTESRFDVLPVPQLYYSFTPTNSALSYGLGLYSPYGLAVKWPDNSGFRSIAIESSLTHLTLNPVVAWKAHPTLSLAFGPNISYSEIAFSRGLAAANDNFKFKGDDVGYGFNAGILWQPLEEWSFGITYRSAFRVNYKGKSTYDAVGATVGTKATLDFPDIVTAGVSYRPNSNWNFEFNVDYTEWNTLNTVTLRGTSAIFGFDLPLQLDWHESWMFGLGATRKFDDGWLVSGGYFYSSSTAPSATFTPAIPDTVLHVASFGVGHQGDKWRWFAAMQFAMGDKRDVRNSQPNPFTAESANGKYQLIVPTLSVSISRQF